LDRKFVAAIAGLLLVGGALPAVAFAQSTPQQSYGQGTSGWTGGMGPGMMGGYGGSYGTGYGPGGMMGRMGYLVTNGTNGWSFQGMWSWCLNETGSFMHGFLGQTP
jgi:hypothetical protein